MERQLDVSFIQDSRQVDICHNNSELLSDNWGAKYVSRSVCRLTFPLWSFFSPTFPLSCWCILSPSFLLSPPLTLPVTLLHCQALSDFCSDPNTFVLNSTNFNTGTSSGTQSTKHKLPEELCVLFFISAIHTLYTLPDCDDVSTTQYNDSLMFPHLFYCALICCVLVFCWPFRCVGLLPDLQQAHEQSVPAGNVTSVCHMSYIHL